MQYAIFDNIHKEYFSEDGSRIFVDLDSEVIRTNKDIELFRDDDKAIAKIVELKEKIRKCNPEAKFDFVLHSLDREVCYMVEPVTNPDVLIKVKAVNEN